MEPLLSDFKMRKRDRENHELTNNNIFWKEVISLR